MKKILFILFFPVLFLTGCSMTVENSMRNIEERDYATILMIQKGQDKRYQFHLGIAQEKIPGEKGEAEELCSFEENNLDELKDEYERTKGKELSLSHLKVILINDICPLEEICPWLNELQDTNEIAKTIPVLEVTEPDKFIEFINKEDTPIGTYLTDLIKTNERGGRKIPWLMDYLKTVREGDSLIVYDIEFQEEGIRLVSRQIIKS